MTGHDLRFLLFAAGISTIFVLNHTDGSIVSGRRGTALFLALALVLIGAVNIPRRRRRRREPTSRELHDTTRPRAWVGLVGRLGLTVAILVIPIAIIEPVVGLVALVVSAAVLLVIFVWHSGAALERGVPHSERWQRSHARVLELSIPVDRALAIAEDELRSGIEAKVVERPASWEVVAQTKGGLWASGQEITVTGVSVSANGSEVRIEARPNGGVLDGGRSWTIVDTLERVLRERSAAEAGATRQPESV
jgi:hypothetical protein